MVLLEGRKVFGNIFKYIKMGASSNFGNMFSMTGASFILPFLPMLPIQIILNNFLYDASQVAIPSDEVDEEYLLKSRSWNIDYIKKFMMYFGPLSSVFDYITFGVMLFIFHAKQAIVLPRAGSWNPYARRPWSFILSAPVKYRL